MNHRQEQSDKGMSLGLAMTWIYLDIIQSWNSSYHGVPEKCPCLIAVHHFCIPCIWTRNRQCRISADCPGCSDFLSLSNFQVCRSLTRRRRRRLPGRGRLCQLPWLIRYICQDIHRMSTGIVRYRIRCYGPSQHVHFIDICLWKHLATSQMRTLKAMTRMMCLMTPSLFESFADAWTEWNLPDQKWPPTCTSNALSKIPLIVILAVGSQVHTSYHMMNVECL